MAGINLWGLAGGSDSFGTGDPSSTSSTATSSGISQGGLGAGIGLAGLGLDIFGASKATEAAKQEAGISKNMAGLEMQVNSQRQYAMQIFARRQQMETIRQGQMASAQSLAAATSQGAQFGSGLQGAQAGITGQSGSNLLGQNQQLAIGNNIFGLDTQISQQKIAMAQAKSDAATAQGEASIGSSLLRAAPTLAGLLLG